MKKRPRVTPDRKAGRDPGPKIQDLTGYLSAFRTRTPS